MEVKIGEPKANSQGIWKSNEKSHAAVFHGYGLGLVDWKDETTEDDLRHVSSLVLDDLKNKIKIMSAESVLNSYGVYNYDRFADRYLIDATISLFNGYEKLGVMRLEDIETHLNEETAHFFGIGEFPHIEYGYIHREDYTKYIVYFISR